MYEKKHLRSVCGSDMMGNVEIKAHESNVGVLERIDQIVMK